MCQVLTLNFVIAQDLHAVKRCADQSTAVYNAVLQDSGEIIFGVGDFNVHDEITPDYVRVCVL